MNIDPKIQRELRELIETQPRKWSRSLLKAEKYKHIFNELMRYTVSYDDITISHRVYWYLSGILGHPKCRICGKNDLGHVRCTALEGYASDCCSMKCRVQTPEYKESRQKLREQNLKLYGVEHSSQRADVKSKVSQALQGFSEEKKTAIKDKRKKTCLERYGAENVSGAKEVQEKIQASFKSRTSEQKAQTRLKTERTLEKKYGKDYRKEIFKDFHNVGQAKRSYEILKKRTDVEVLCTQDEYVKKHISKDFKIPFRCTRCGKETEVEYYSGLRNICPYCKDDKASISSIELELHQFVSSIYSGKVEFNTRKVIYPLELDIYVPEKKLAIELDGLYWHNDDNKPKRYHLDKTEKCLEKGIGLIHVFENEWHEKQDIVKSRLRNLLGSYDKVVYARKCQVKEVSSSDSMKFQAENHIQGAIGAKVHLGLYDGAELVSLMTFGKSRFSSKCEWELLRFCSKLGYHVPGAAGKLLKHFEQSFSPASIVSYADRRWSRGKVYEALGFKLDHVSAPDYWYFKNGSWTLESRVKYQKHKLPKLLKEFDESLSEPQNMKKNGYMRIFDCGNLAYMKLISPK